MKKLGILVMSLVLVCGMSLGVLAQLAGDEIDINASVAEKATIEIDGSIDLDIDKLTEFENDDAAKMESHNNSEVIVRANTPVKVTFEENLSKVLAEILGNKNLVWAFNTYNTPEGVQGDDWVVSPNVTIDAFEWDTDPMTMYPHTNGMAKDVYLEQGYNKLEVGMETKWRQKDNEENMLKWYDLLAKDEITSTVTVTVESNK
jgi:hypothetical protein